MERRSARPGPAATGSGHPGAPARTANGARWYDPGAAAAHNRGWRTPIPWPSLVGALPAEVPRHQDRDIAAALDEPRHRDQRIETTGPVHVVHGPPGTGKTVLVAHHLRTLWDAGEIDLVVWIDAGGADAIASALAEAAELADRGSGDLPGAGARAGHFLRWARDTHKRWAIVLDDLADPADAAGLWPTGNFHGRLIVTTRAAPPDIDGAIVIRTGPYRPMESYEFLGMSLLGEPELLDGAHDLAEDLGHLPLPLAQAAAYVRDQKVTCADYRKLFAAAVEAGAPDETDVTAGLCLDVAGGLASDAVARPLLEILAVLDGGGVPPEVAEQPVVLHHLGRRTGRPVAVADVREALDRLHSLALIVSDPAGDGPAMLRVAGPTAAAVLARVPAGEHGVAAHVAAEALSTAWPKDDVDGTVARALRGNAAHLRDTTGAALWTPDCHLVLLRLGDGLGAAGLAAAAATHFGAMARLALRHLGPDHPRTLAGRHRHAHWSGEAGDVKAAVEGFARLLHDRVRLFGPEHPDTLDAWDRLAVWQGRGGDAAGAAENLAVLYEQCGRVLGPGHPDTVRVGGHLAAWLGAAQGPAAAVRVLAGLVETCPHELGAEHPETLSVRHDMATWHGRGGAYAAAAASLASLLATRTRLLGAEHPDTLLTRHDLLHWRGCAGEDVTGEYRKLLADAAYVLGPGHPQTVAARESLGYWG